MADRFEVFDITVPAGTAKTAPVETSTGFADGVLAGVQVVIPDGHSGLTGIALLQAHSQMIPWTSGAFITGNDEVIPWDTRGFIVNGAWSVLCYNTDVYDHTFHVRFLVNETSIVGPGSPQAVTVPVVVGAAPPADDTPGIPGPLSYPVF